MQRSLVFFIVVAAVVSCNSKVDPFKPIPECKGAAVVPFMGSRQMLISSLAIADFGEGFDLDLDGKKDNKLAPLGALANSEIANTFMKSHDIIIPVEMFGYDGEANSQCVKAAFYIGAFNKDRDMDGSNDNSSSGDCLDIDAKVKPGMPEDLTNRLDDDCDGFADNPIKGSKPTDNQDLDGDGYTLAQGDCDDRTDTPEHLALAKTRHPGAKDVCNDGIDQNCDGIPDNDPSCDPFSTNFVTIDLTAQSFADATASPLQPLIAFKEGKIHTGQLNAGPDLFSVNIPIQNRNIALMLSGARLQMVLADNFAVKQTSAHDGLLGGVLEAITLAQITNLNAGGVIKKDQSLLDAVFVGPVGTILGLDSDKDQHLLPDIDVDGDGLETFYNENAPVGGASLKVDTCKDGDGTIIRSTPDMPCALAKDKKGNYRFVDGLSVALKFTTVPVNLSGMIVPK